MAKMTSDRGPLETLPHPRPILVFNHNPKAGGGSVLTILRDSFDCEVKKFGNGTYDGDPNDPSCFVHVEEDASAGRADRRGGFVIGSVREPCSQYVSKWSFASSGFGGKKFRLEGMMGQDGPYFNSTEDVGRFRDYVRDPLIFGWVSKRLFASYVDTLPEGGSRVGLEVDCWVFVDDFQESLLGCLRMFDEQGGHVNWDSPGLSALVRFSEAQHGRRLMKPHKNDPLGNPQEIHHAPCSTYFDEETASLIENGPDSVIYQTFGYVGCCKGRMLQSPIPAAAAGKSDMHSGSVAPMLSFLLFVSFALFAARWWSEKKYGGGQNRQNSSDNEPCLPPPKLTIICD